MAKKNGIIRLGKKYIIKEINNGFLTKLPWRLELGEPGTNEYFSKRVKAKRKAQKEIRERGYLDLENYRKWLKENQLLIYSVILLFDAVYMSILW